MGPRSKSAAIVSARAGRRAGSAANEEGPDRAGEGEAGACGGDPEAGGPPTESRSRGEAASW